MKKKVWYCQPGKEPIVCETSATDISLWRVVIRIPDPYDQGKLEITVPGEHLVLSALSPATQSVMDAVWAESFTNAGYQYGADEEENARAWFEKGYRFMEKRGGSL